jgi:CO/xanthine dehydrogenase Mo-binding subunit
VTGKPALPGSLAAIPRLSRWLAIGRDGTVTVTSGKVELGQGILTALAQIVAEELDVDLDRIRMAAADTTRSPNEGVTSGSLSIQDSGAALRRVCAEARALLIERAAERLDVRANLFTVEDGTVSGGGRSATYWELIDDALLDRDATGTVAPKAPADYRVVGKAALRRDLPDKVMGRPRYVQDLVLPDMLYGRIVRPDRRFARLLSVDETKARAVPGVVEVVRDGSFLGVLAEREDAAIAALRALRRDSRWEDAPAGPTDIDAWLRTHAVEDKTISEKTDEAAAARARRRFAASFAKPYLSHAPIGPSCAAARWRDGGVEIWTHSQGVYNLRRDLAMVLGLAADAIVVRHVEGSGCYGHNGADDVALDAALLARAVPGRPVLLQWMRDDEFGWAPSGPAMAVDLAAALDADGRIVDWRHELWSNGHGQRPGRGKIPTLLASWHLAQPFPCPPAMNGPLPAGAADRNAIPLYSFANQRVVNHYVRDMPIRVSALRSLGGFANVFAIESFMDELASAAGADPVAFRLRHLEDPRGRAVIEAAARRAGWADWKASDGCGHGIGFAKYKNLGAYCAVVAKVEVEREVRVRRLVIAVDAGLAVNPDGIANQIEGGAVQATSWTLKERVAFDERGIASRGWEDYPILRFSEVPAVEVEVVDRPDLPSVGAGEAAQGPTGAAIANAVGQALGVRVRTLPLTADTIRAAIERA